MLEYVDKNTTARKVSKKTEITGTWRSYRTLHGGVVAAAI